MSLADLGQQPGDRETPESRLESLITRMRAGDREAAAIFIVTYGSRIRRRIRGKLGPSMRRLFDSQEILSTLGRRLDTYVREHRLEATEEGQLWTLVFRMAENAMVDKARVYQRLQTVEGSDSPFAHDLLRRMRLEDADREDGAEALVDQALSALPDEEDRQVLSLWLNGFQLQEIATHLEVSSDAARKRWERIKDTLRSVLSCNRAD